VKKKYTDPPPFLYTAGQMGTPQTYYKEVYPYEQVANWLAPLGSRELSVTRNGFQTRNRFAANARELEWLLRFPTPCQRADWGPLVDEEGQPVAREFTIDLDDYTPCAQCAAQPKNICAACWDSQMAAKAARMVSYLHQEWRCERVGTFFSGGRSLQVVVRDEGMRIASKEQRFKMKTRLETDLRVTADKGAATIVNHLLRLPFTVNPLTRRICIPIDPHKCTAEKAFLFVQDATPEVVGELSKLLLSSSCLPGS
jgi:DNA primase catalytic subunit